MEEFFTRLNEFHKKYSRYFLMLLLIVAVFIVFKVLPFLITLFLPFVIAWGVSFAASPLTKFMKHKLHLPYRVCGITTVLLLIGLLVLIVSMIFSFILKTPIKEVINIISIYKILRITNFTNSIRPYT